MRFSGRTMTRLVTVALPVLLTACVSPIEKDTVSGQAVTVYRDDWGVPHIYAATEALGFYGLGYAQAEDRLTKLLGAVYWSQGRRAELEGEALLASDIEQRRWRHTQEGSAGFARLDAQVRNNYRAFVAGVEHYMTEHPEQVPAWAPPLDVVDLVSINRAVFWAGYAAVLGPAECRQPEDNSQSGIPRYADRQSRGASNGWVLAPARTANGATLLLADPHVELQSPAYYEYRIHAGELESAGFALGPLLWQAHNRHVSWAMTTGNPDMWDCYAVEVDPDNPSRYRYDGEWRDMLRMDETFAVRGGATVEKTFEYTRHNGVLSPVVARDGTTAFVVSTSQMHDAGLLENEIHAMNHAGSVRELRSALRSLGMFPQNLVAGDAAGGIYYLRAGKTPVRPAGYDWTGPVPGNGSETAWRGFYTLDDMVERVNPPQGFIQNNNASPDRMFAAGNLDASDYPTGVFNDTPGRITTRGLRSIEVLSDAEHFTIADAREHAFDETWVTAGSWIWALGYALDQLPEWLEQQQAETVNLVHRLLSFDGVASSDSVAALNFYYWRAGMPEVLQAPGFEHLQTLPWDKADFSPEFASAILSEAARAANTMIDELGSTDVAMGTVFRVGRGEGSWPLGGETITAPDIPSCLADLSPLCERTMRAFASGPPNERGQRRAYRGSTAMRLVELGEPLRSWSLYVHGQSDDPGSPHYDDQARLLSERRFKPTYFNRDELEGHIASTTVLTPRGDFAR